MSPPLLFAMDLQYEQDVVLGRQVARRVAALLGFDVHDQTRIATAVSEVARSVFREGSRGRIQFHVTEDAEPSCRVTISGGREVNAAGGGSRDDAQRALGLAAAQRLMDDFASEVLSGVGSVVTLHKRIPKRGPPLSHQALNRIADDLMKRGDPQNAFEEVRHQNTELMALLEKLREREAELARMNRELEETNRGIIALYAELDEKAASLQRANEVKTRFLSNMTHEFRTPLSSVLSLTRMLLEDEEEKLSAEQETQVKYIRKAVTELSEMVNDLLDLAKVEAGKVSVRVESFAVADLLAALRGMFRPLIPDAVRLVIEDSEEISVLRSDEAKISQILRNLISNAIKFTPQGEVRVSVRDLGDGSVEFSVADTGIGIPPSECERIFEEFAQVESQEQKKTKGTGLGLPLARRLAELLGGAIEVRSEPGRGSTFTLRVPAETESAEAPMRASSPDVSPPRNEASGKGEFILIIDDNETARYLLSERLRGAGYSILDASDGREGLMAARRHRPGAIFLDLRMPGMDGFEVLEALSTDPATKDIPVVVHTSLPLDAETRRRLEAQAFAVVSKDEVWGGDLVLPRLRARLEETPLNLRETSVEEHRA